MKYVALLILLGLAHWYLRRPAPPVVHIVPHCFDRGIGMFLPCSDVDRYESSSTTSRGKMGNPAADFAAALIVMLGAMGAIETIWLARRGKL